MTVDWTKFRDGDRVRVTFEGVWELRRMILSLGDLSGVLMVNGYLKAATSAELITPEIVTGAAYVDADGNAYLGGTEAGTVVGTAPGADALQVFGDYPSRPLPAGLRRAKVVPE